jgi:branched-subunit amino acid transport protein
VTDLMAVVLTGVGTFLTRASFIVALARRPIPETLLEVLTMVAPSVLGALTLSLLLDPQGNLVVAAPEAAALVVGGAVAYKTRNLVLMVVAGMVVYWGLRALL